MDYLFKNIRLINPTENIDKNVNLWIKDGIVAHCSEDKPKTNDKTVIIESDKLVAAPGFFDMHVHLREPGQESKEDVKSGTEAAANGGFTAVCCMPNTSPVIDNAPIIEYIKLKSKGLLTDVFISGSITQNRDGKHISPMLELDDSGVVMFTDDGGTVMSAVIMRRAFEYSATRDLLLSQHCEDHTLTEGFSMNEGMISTKLGLKGYPAVAEEIILARDIMLSEYCANRRYHVSHISTKGAVRLIREAKKWGLRITCEVTPHHLSLSDELLTTYNTNLKMNPPLRTKEDIEALIEGLEDGTIDCIATDHAPHTLYEKDVEFELAPCGIIGLETAIGVIMTNLYHTKRLSLAKIIEKMSVNPRKILGLKEVDIKKGVAANITIFAPDEEWIVNKNLFKSKSSNTPYNDYRFKGKPKYAINNNQIYESNL